MKQKPKWKDSLDNSELFTNLFKVTIERCNCFYYFNIASTILHEFQYVDMEIKNSWGFSTLEESKRYCETLIKELEERLKLVVVEQLSNS